MNETQRRILTHALGLSRRPSPYRNRYYATTSHVDYPEILLLIGAGFMRLGRMDDGMGTFHVTEAGEAALRATPPQEAPK